NVAGSLVAYYAGVWGGRPFAERYGPYMLVSRKDIEMADRWFAKYGEAAVFFGRMLPVIRTFISLPAGIAGMNIYRFVLLTFLGALPWGYLLAYIGVKMGEQWEHLRDYFHQFDIVIGLCLALGLGYFLWSHWPKRRITPELYPVHVFDLQHAHGEERTVLPAPAEDRSDVRLWRDGLRL